MATALITRAEAATNTNPSFNGAGVSAPVLKLAEAVGLLKPVPNEPENYQVNGDWFSDPLANTGSAFKNNGGQIAELLVQLLGEISGNALGVPAQNLGDLGTWLPIVNPVNGKPTGFYLATFAQGEDQVFGIGILHTWKVSLGSGTTAITGPDAIEVRTWGLMPILKLGGGSLALVLGQAGFPMQLGVQIAGENDQTIIDVNGFSFTGIKVTAGLDLQAEQKLSLSIVVLKLKLPTEEEPRDRSLSDLANLPGSDILSTAAALFISALGEFTGQQGRASYLLPVLGLSPIVPNDATRLPLLDWVQFLDIAKNGGNLAEPFIDWFNRLLADPKLLKAWLASVGGLMNGTQTAINGSGSRQDPFQLPILSVNGIGSLSFTAASQVTEAGNRLFFPGLSFASDLIKLGSAPVSLLIAARLELAQFELSDSGGSMRAGFTLNFDAGLNLVSAEGPEKPLFEGEIAGGQYRFGSIFAGMTLANVTGSPVVNPQFQLLNVATPNGEYETIDLTRPGDLVEQAKAELFTLIDNALKTLFDVNGPLALGRQAAVLLGVIPPPDVDWPTNLAPPFSAAQLPSSLENPLAAFINYYAQLIDPANLVEGKNAFFYFVEQVSALFQRADLPPITVSGSGTRIDPWQARLTDLALPAALTAFHEDSPGVGYRRLMLGLALTPEITVAGIKFEFSIVVHALGLDLPKTPGDPVSAIMFPGVDFNLNLPQGVTTPTVAGAALKVANADATANWSPYSGWTWSMFVAQPNLIVDGITLPIGEDLNFSDQDSLQKLVTQLAATFSPLLPAVLGVAVYRTGTRAGLAFNGILGLLPNLAPFVPEGLTWPSDMPVLKPTNFNDPIGDIRGQLKAVFADEARARAATTLFAWAVGSAEKAPELTGDGSFEKPFLAPTELPGALDLAIWFDAAKTLLGAGIARTIDFDLPLGFKAKTLVRINAVQVNLDTGSRIADAMVPGASMHCLITGFPEADSALSNADPRNILDRRASNAAGGIEKLELSLSLGSKDGSLILTPGVAVRANGTTITLAEITGSGSEQTAVFYALVNAAIQSLSKAAGSDSAFQRVYNVLALMGLALPVKKPTDQHGIDPAGWRGMLADPLGYIGNRLLEILADPDNRAELMQLIYDLTGIQPPTIPTAALQVLEALGFVTDADHGFALVPAALTELFANPVQTLANRFLALVNDAVKLADLLDQLAANFTQVSFGPFEFSIRDGGLVAFSLPPKNALDVGGFIKISGLVGFNFNSKQLIGQLRLYVPSINLSLMADADFVVSPPIGPNLQLSLAFGNGVEPGPPPLVFFPFDLDSFINQLAKTAPAYTLSTFLTGVLDEKVLNPYPLAQSLFTLLGIGFKDENGKWYTKSLLGLLEDPVAWLLSDAVIGADGSLNIARIRDVLATIPDVRSSIGLGIKQVADGVQIFGLPYNLAIDVTTEINTTAPGESRFLISPNLSKLSLAGAILDDLRFSLGIGPNFQPGFSGLVQVSGTVGGEKLALCGGYQDKQFFLSAGVAESLFAIIPFPGWQALAADILRLVAQKLLEQLTQLLLKALKSFDNPVLTDFIERLESAAGKLQVAELVQALIDSQSSGSPDPAKLGKVALDWLAERVSETHVKATMEAIAHLFQGFVSGIEAKDGLIRYQPSASLPVTIEIGARDLGGLRQLGLWASLQPPATNLLQIGIQPTGIGIDLANLDGGPLFNLDFSLVVPLDDDTGPKLSLRFDNISQKFQAGMDPQGTLTTNSSLFREILPVFFSEPDPAKLPDAVVAWLQEIAINVLPRYISVVVLNTNTVKKWLDDPILSNGTGPKPGDILVAAQILVRSNSKYALNSIQNLLKLTVEEFLARFLKALLETEIQVLKIGEKGGIWVGPQFPGSGNFGVRAMIPDIKVAALPNLVFQLGAVDDSWIGDSGGDPDKFKPGLAVYVPIDNITPQFDKTRLNVVNLGVDFVGKQNRPLVELSRFSLGAVKPRGLISFDFGAASIVSNVGGAIILDNIAISLAPNAQIAGPKVNPVAQNLLGSGTSNKDDNPPANPGFSLSAAYSKKLSVKLFDPDGNPETKVWIPVQRSFGPLHCNKVGIGWQEDDFLLSILFDGSVSLAGLYLGLTELAIGVPVKTPTDFSKYTLGLAGLDIAFNGGAVTVSGGLIKTDNPLAFTGQALLKLTKFSLNAMGSFALLPVDPNDPNKTAPSFFAFLNLNIPMGPDPAFFIDGIAAGFGFNRNIKIPEPGDIARFPLVAGAISSATFGGGDATPESALSVLVKENVVFPQLGQYWLAAGIKFSNYKLLDTFALLFIRFGREFAIDLVGVTSGSLPPQAPPTLALAYMELGLVVSWRPGEGLISARAQLTPNSFLLARDCKLTGGFAAQLYYAGKHAGQFVITFGGYHPAFDKPDFYPAVPRLGFNWPITDQVGISGGAYFALTPSAIMAGGHLSVLFEAGPLRAWLDAAANFLIAWQPFYYEVDISVSVGVEFHTKIAGVSSTLKVSLGASLALSGPPTAGEAKVSWYVISFTIPIGKQPELKKAPLSWSQFEQAFLPQPPADPPVSAVARTIDESAPESQEVVKTQVSAGLIKEDSDGWVLQSQPFTLEVTTVIPPDTLTITGSSTRFSGPGMGIRPMNLPAVNTPLVSTIQARKADGSYEDVDLPAEFFSFANTRRGAPDALWSKQFFNPNGPPVAGVLDGTLATVSITAKEPVLSNFIGPIDILRAFSFEHLNPFALPLAGDRGLTPAVPISQGNNFQRLQETIMAAPIAAKRNAILDALDNHGLPTIADPNLAIIAQSAPELYQAPPTLARLGVDLATTVSNGIAVQRTAQSLLSTTPVVAKSHLLGGVHFVLLGQRPVTGLQLGLPSRPQSGRWLDETDGGANGRGLQHFQSQGNRGDSASSEFRLFSGSVIAVAVSQTAWSLQSTGAAGARVLQFDHHHQLIEDSLLEEGHELGFHPACCSFAAQGVDLCAQPAVLGWQRNSLLTRVSYYRLLGEGFSLRPQAPPPKPVATRKRASFRGLIDAAAVLESNRIDNGCSKTEPGWLETLFTSFHPFVAVLSRGKDAPRVRLAVGDQAENPVYGELSKPLERMRAGDERLWIYQTPPGKGRYLAVLTAGSGLDAGICAVYTLHCAADEACWKQLQLPCCGREMTRADTSICLLKLNPVRKGSHV